MSVRTIVGLDLSLTSTGIAVIGPPGIQVADVVSKATGDTIDARSARLRRVAGKIHEWCIHSAPDPLIVIEQPAYSRQTGHMHDRSGLWWLTVARLTGIGVGVVEVSPTVVKKYATGKGGASKDAVLAAVIRRYPAVEVANNNQADALVLAAMGSRHLGTPIEESLPAVQVAAMATPKWPSTGEVPF